MPKIAYSGKRLSSASLAVIDHANEIIEEYQSEGYTLTLRQLYYQFVSRDLIENKQSEYKRLGGIISDGRRAGLIDWNAIEDRTRNLQSPSTWDNPSDIIRACAKQFAVDLWEDQSFRPEVWIEKDALLNVLEAACDPLQVPYFSCRGYTSDSEVWAAGQRMDRCRRGGQTPFVIHLGDHDPSGIDMTRDITSRLDLFSGGTVQVKRIALNMKQIKAHKPPPNPAKATDARFAGYQEKYGDESWELDALEPKILVGLIQAEIGRITDDGPWQEAVERQTFYRSQLDKVSESWSEIVEGL